MRFTNYSFKSMLVLAGILLLVFLLGLIYGINSYDFKAFYDAGMLARHKTNIYLPVPSTGLYVFYLPFFSILMMPFTFIPRQISSLLFFYLNIIMLIILFKNLLTDFKQDIDTNKNKIIAIILILIMILPFLADNFKLGQVNLVVCFIIYLSLKLYYDKKLDFSAFLLALSGFKIIPLIFFFFVSFTKKIRYISLYLIFLLFFSILPFLHFGIKEGFHQYENLYKIATLKKAGIYSSGLYEVKYQSIWRFFSSFLKAIHINNNLVLSSIILTLLLITLIYAFYLTRKLYNTDRKTIYFVGSLFLVLMLLFSPASTKPHFTMLLLPYSLLVFEALRTKNKTEIILISFILIANIFYSRDLVGRKIYTLAQSYYLYMIVMLVLLAYIFSKLRAFNKRANSKHV